MLSSGINWGRPSENDNTALAFGVNVKENIVLAQEEHLASQLYQRKRRLHDTDSKVHKSVHNQRTVSPPMNYRNKRSRTPKIVGQKLPLSRAIEVLDKESLQELLHKLSQIHPEVVETMEKLCPKPSFINSIGLIKEKFNSIIHHLPYKCETESDYSYMRVKCHLNEFFNCISDFILNYLPPLETSMSISIRLLDEITALVSELPNFTSSDFQYTKSIAYEQIANAWLIALNHLGSKDESNNAISQSILETPGGITPGNSNIPVLSQVNIEESLSIFKLVQELGLEERVTKYNEVSNGKFKLVEECIKTHGTNCEEFSSAERLNNRGVFGDLITLDYSNYSLSAKGFN